MGEVVVLGVKNSVVVLIFVIIFVDDVVVLDGVLVIFDVDSLVDIMEIMGVKIKCYGEMFEIDLCGVKDILMFYGKINSFCVFYYFYGSLLGCYG